MQEDPTKPVFDSMMETVVQSLSGEARDFYDREFSFFNEVTSISGKLKPYIKKTKLEKKVLIFCCTCVRNLTHLKAKIDEEMSKISVDVGVYLPSNPDGKVVDIDKKSGRPLQSHAKVPFINHRSIGLFEGFCRPLSWQRSKSEKRKLRSTRILTPFWMVKVAALKRALNMTSGSRQFSKSVTTVAKTFLLCKLLLCSKTFSSASALCFIFFHTE